MNSIAILLITTLVFFTESQAGPVKKKSGDMKLEQKDVIYTGQRDIVKIYTSVALLEETQQRTVFFIEGDINKDGSIDSKGLYVIIDNSTTKLLDDGRDIAGDSTGKVFFATNEGLYTYNRKEHTAHKYGFMNEAIISLAVENNTGVVYALTENHVLFKITENGNKSEVDDRVKHAKAISIDWHDNLFYYGENKNLHVLVDELDRIIDDLPKNPQNTKLVKPPFGVEGMFMIADDVPYVVYSNSTVFKSKDTTIQSIKPTAYSLDAMVVLYFGYEKKIYEINLIAKVLEGIFERVSDWAKANLSFITFS